MTGGLSRVVSISSLGAPANLIAREPSLSRDGRIVAFETVATNLAPEDTDFTQDVIVHDCDADEDGIYDEPGEVATELVSVSTGGQKGNGASGAPDVSGNGRFVAFESNATNLVDDDSSSRSDVFVRDRLLGTTVRVSVSDLGSEGDGASGSPSMDFDGRLVAFDSIATNLDFDTNTASRDVFVRDLDAGTTELVSLAADGGNGFGDSFQPSIGPVGRWVAFASDNEQLVDVAENDGLDIFLRDTINATTRLLSSGTPRAVRRRRLDPRREVRALRRADGRHARRHEG